jgi:hypothetical protein
MKRTPLILCGVLGAQLGLAALLAFSGDDNAAFQASEPLIAFDQARIDEIAISQSGGGSTTLKKESGRWVVPAMAGFPADPQKVNGLLTKLSELKKGWPVATSAEAAKRFKLTEDSHERRIALSSAGKPVTTLLIGSSPTFRLVNARTANDAAIYTVTFAAYEAGLRNEDWIDKETMTLPADQVSSIVLPDATLERKEGKWQLAGLAEGQKPLDAKVQDAARAVLRPQFDAVTGKGAEALAALAQPDLQIEVKKADGSARTYRYKKEAAGGAYLFAASDGDYVYRVSETSAAPIVDARRAALIEQPKPPENKGADPAAPAAQAPAAQAAPTPETAPPASGG